MLYFRTIFILLIVVFVSLILPETVYAGGFIGVLDSAIEWGIDTGRVTNLGWTNIIGNIITFLANLVGILSLLGIVIGGILYVVSTGNEQRSAQAKRIISFSLLGLLIVLARWLFTEAVYTWLGLTPPAAIAPPAGLTFTVIINNIIAFIRWFIAAASTLLIIVGGIRYITSVGDEQKTTKAKQTIFAALTGLFIALIASILVAILEGIATDTAAPAALADLGLIIFNIISFSLAFTSTIAVAAFIYGGFTYLTSGGSEEKLQRGKKIIIYAIVGIVVIMISATIVNIVIIL